MMVDDLMNNRLRWENNVMLGLHSLKTVQTVVSWPVKDAVPDTGEVPTKDAVRSYFTAMHVELGELLQTLDWKPWKGDEEQCSIPDKARTADEFADVLAFLGVILTHLNAMGLDTAALAKAYTNKTRTNIERFKGVHGVEYRNVQGDD